jgi:hypothetical protein
LSGCDLQWLGKYAFRLVLLAKLCFDLPLGLVSYLRRFDDQNQENQRGLEKS